MTPTEVAQLTVEDIGRRKAERGFIQSAGTNKAKADELATRLALAGVDVAGLTIDREAKQMA